MHIKNLINSPYPLVAKGGKTHIIPAFGEIDIEPHPMHVNQYKQVGYFVISESPEAPKNPKEPDSIDKLREEYAAIAGKPADGRWSAKKLRAEIDAQLEP